MRQTSIRNAVIGLDLFEAASAIVGAVGLIVGFMNIPTAVLQGTPFGDFVIPAMLLGMVVGGSALVAAVITAFASPRTGAVASGIAGAMTVGYLCVEIAMIGLNAWPQVVWFGVGLAMIALSAFLWQSEPGFTTAPRAHQTA